MSFFKQVSQIAETNDSHLCIGLDPDISRIPEHLRDSDEAIFDFCCAIVDSTKDLACAYKPQIAYFASEVGNTALVALIKYIHNYTDVPVILDAKRADIESTSEKYAVEAFEVFGADAVTVNPYLGVDGIAPFTSYSDKGVFVLCKTSNASAAQVQNCRLDNGKRLYEHIAELACTQWNNFGNVGLVVGATMPEEAAAVRSIVGSVPLLVPGVGAQGGDLGRIIAAAAGGEILINSARAVNYAGTDENYAVRAREAAAQLRDDINEIARRQNKPVFQVS